MVTGREVTYYGMRYFIAELTGSPDVILSVIPTLLSIYL
jgi:hypothetical protein